MAFFRGRSTPLVDDPGEAPADPKTDAQQRRDTGGALVADRSRAWLLPGGGEMFRSVYTRTSTDVSEVLGVTSAIAGEGKSTVSLGLAVTAAQDFPERQVLLVETDLQKPTLAIDFGMDPHPGLVDYLVDDEPLGATYRPTMLDNLYLLPSGGPFNNPGRLLRSRRMGEAIDSMRETYDLIVLDMDGLLVNSDTGPLTDLADGVIVVVRAGVTPTALVNKAVSLIDESRLRGVILNDTRSFVPQWLRRLCGV